MTISDLMCIFEQGIERFSEQCEIVREKECIGRLNDFLYFAERDGFILSEQISLMKSDSNFCNWFKPSTQVSMEFEKDKTKEVRVDPFNGRPYTKEEFISYYGDDGVMGGCHEWNVSPQELPDELNEFFYKTFIWQGKREGYTFMEGVNGVGYYRNDFDNEDLEEQVESDEQEKYWSAMFSRACCSERKELRDKVLSKVSPDVIHEMENEVPIRFKEIHPNTLIKKMVAEELLENDDIWIDIDDDSFDSLSWNDLNEDNN